MILTADPQTSSTISEQERSPARPASAVVWIDDRAATVAMMDALGRIRTCAIDRCDAPETLFLDLVIHAIGERDRIVILGPDAARLELERAYVALESRRDVLVDVEPAGAVDEPALVDRLRELSS